jgi:hypothetical protein
VRLFWCLMEEAIYLYIGVWLFLWTLASKGSGADPDCGSEPAMTTKGKEENGILNTQNLRASSTPFQPKGEFGFA